MQVSLLDQYRQNLSPNSISKMRLSGWKAWLISTSVWMSTFELASALNNPSNDENQIPQFILDTGHPWIRENLRALQGIDAKQALCNLDSSLRAPLEPIPIDLFKNVTISDKERGFFNTPPDWSHSVEILEDILNCPLGLQSCEYLQVDFYQRRRRPGRTADPDTPPKELAHLVAKPLKSMPNLERLEWIRPSEGQEVKRVFEETFVEDNVQLPTIRSLSLGPNMHFLVRFCPTLESLTTSGGRVWHFVPVEMEHNFVRAAVGALNLKDFGMRASWSKRLLGLVLENVPQVETLHIDGDIENMEHMVRNSGDKLRALARILARFRNISRIWLPDSASLDLGFDGGPMCGNSYLGRRGRKFSREVTRKDMWATQTAASIILLGSPNLDSITVGSWTTTGIINGKAQWPWTGRVKAYLIERHPRYRLGEYLEEEDDDDIDEGLEDPIFPRGEMNDAALRDDWDPRVCLNHGLDQTFAKYLGP
ncbi:hypothetical protein B0J13DRAFT_674240 [Dactylonectria estremocensis]|uniref:Uncharacterized protein n=1 Tax=Dactylonectria estremocensis TaxID=1079267 RepID=A0A9P9EZV3_9HYPO|nr:hypothetical protein B0J13DRAFT_674240 [Dactylonectria estremocensis]